MKSGNDSIRICHFTSAHRYNDVRIFLKQCSSLAGEYETFLIATNCETRVVNNVHVVSVNSRFTSRLYRFLILSFRVFLAARRTKSSVYHFHDPELLPYGFLLKLSGKKVIYDVHEDYPKQILGKYWINKFLRRLTAGSFRLFEDYTAGFFDCIITATPAINERFRKYHKFCVNVNNYPLREEFASIRSGPKSKEICYVGSVTEIRGIVPLIEAMGELDDVVLHLAGEISPSSLRGSLAGMKGWSNVVEYGQVSRDKVSEIMSKSVSGIVTFLPLPNHVDAQPNKIFEYMSAGLVVIASDFPLWRDIVIKNDCGYCVDPENPAQIAEAIRKVVSDPAVTARKGQNGKRAVDILYNWDVEKVKLLDAYARLTRE